MNQGNFGYQQRPNYNQSQRSGNSNSDHSRSQPYNNGPPINTELNELLKKVKIWENLDPNLFDSVANKIADQISKISRDKNKYSQLRKFYDELVDWQEKIGNSDTEFQNNLPFLMMLKSKIAYAEGRKHVSSEFSFLIGDLLDQTLKANNPRALLNAKLFFEAFLGFYRTYNHN